jgi:hypothetical protein
LFALIVLLKFYRDDNAVGVGIENRKIIPRFIVVNNTGIIEKKLMPIEKAIIKIEGEIQELVHEPVNKELHEDQKKKDLSRPIMFSSILKDAETKEPTSKSVVNTTEVQETLDMSYDKVAEKPRKYLKKEVISIQNLSPDIKINPYLSRVQEEHVFILRDGKRVCSIEELVKELKLMNDDVFKYHVTDYKNDFATWIYNTLGYKELAEAIGPIKSREKMIDMVQFGIDRLNS